jgi:hypothetical protein
LWASHIGNGIRPGFWVGRQTPRENEHITSGLA